MGFWDTINEKITTRNIIALSVTGVFLIVIGQMIFNPGKLLVVVADNTEWIVTGAIIFGVLLGKWSDIIQFYFRKPQSKETK